MKDRTSLVGKRSYVLHRVQELEVPSESRRRSRCDRDGAPELHHVTLNRQEQIFVVVSPVCHGGVTSCALDRPGRRSQGSSASTSARRAQDRASTPSRAAQPAHPLPYFRLVAPTAKDRLTDAGSASRPESREQPRW